MPSSSTTPSLGEDLGDRDAGGEHGAGLLGGVGDREADHPHAALDVAPHRALALEVALVVHELDRRGALVLRAGLGADDALAEERVLEALVARCGRRAPRRSRRSKTTSIIVCSPCEQLLELGAGRRLADPGVALAGAQALADLVEEVLVGPVALDVGLALTPSASRSALRAGVVEPLAERGAVLERDPQVGVGDVDLEAALLAAASSSITSSSSRPTTYAHGLTT